jgi:hypothetical protein
VQEIALMDEMATPEKSDPKTFTCDSKQEPQSNNNEIETYSYFIKNRNLQISSEFVC